MTEKEPTIRIGRREFTAKGVMLLLSGVAVTIAADACGSSSPTSPTTTPAPPAADNTATSISNNHGHIAIVTGAQITAKNSVTLNIQGNASHPHTLDLSAAEVGQIGSKVQVAKQSSTDNGHSHTVTFN